MLPVMVLLAGWMLTGKALRAESAAPVKEQHSLSDGRILQWITLEEGSDAVEIKKAVEECGGTLISLAPEGRLVAALPSEAIQTVRKLPGVRGVEDYLRVRLYSPSETGEESRGGALTQRTKTRAALDVESAAPRIAPNELSRKRAALQGLSDLPSSVDNSISDYFPPIGNQGGQNSCVGWATCYYYNTQLQARDEGLIVSGEGLSSPYICSPAFLYNLLNKGIDGGLHMDEAMKKLGETGCCSLQLMGYDSSNYTRWPTEAAWIEALPRRTLNYHVISLETDEGLTAAKQILANGQLLATTSDVYTSWVDWSMWATGINNNVLYAHSGTYKYGHAMTIVGYDDNREYNDGTAIRRGAFLVANSRGNSWGCQNSSGSGDKGFCWVAYQYAKDNNNCFDEVHYTDDRPRYHPKLYAATGINQTKRDKIKYCGGVGVPPGPLQESYYPISTSGGSSVSITDQNRAAVDLTDVVLQAPNYNQIDLFVKCTVSSSANSNSTLTSADFYSDLDGDGTYTRYASASPPVTIVPGQTGYATTSFRGDDLATTPGAGMVARGYQGGPFSPTSFTYTITNNGAQSYHWSSSIDVPWAAVSPNSGMLDPGGSVPVICTIQSPIEQLAAGSCMGALTIKNEDTGVLQQRSIQATVDGLASIPFTEDFEKGTPLALYWTLTGTNYYTPLVSTSNGPHGGLYHLTLADCCQGGSFSRNELTLTINLEGASNVELRFWAKSFNDEPHGPPPSPFIGGADFDGVAVSSDGNQWYEILGLRGIPTSSTEFVVNLDQAIANVGLTYNHTFRIRFNQYDDDPVAALSTDGIGLDDISIVSAAPATSSPTVTPESSPIMSPTPEVTTPPPTPSFSPTPEATTPPPSPSLTPTPEASTPSPSPSTSPTPEVTTPPPSPSSSPTPEVTATPSESPTPPIAPEQPMNQYPEDGAINVPPEAHLQASAFSSTLPEAFHSASQWQVRPYDSPADYSQAIYNSGETGSHRTDIWIPPYVLQNLKFYSWRVKYRDQFGTYSPWSEETVFQVEPGPIEPVPPDAPVNLSPVDDQVGVDIAPMLIGSVFSDLNVGDIFTGVQWQIRQHPGDYFPPIYDSGEVATGYRSHRVPLGVLQRGTYYFWHVRYRDSTDRWSEWSEETGFETIATGALPAPEGLRASPGARSVWLTWMLPHNYGITHFNVYRSNPTSGDFELRSRTPVRQLEYQDLDLAPGVTYYYAVTAASLATGLESAQTKPVPAVVGTVSLHMTALRGRAGELVTQLISAGNPNYLTDRDLDVRIRYDPDLLTPQEVKKTSITNGLSFRDNVTTANGLLVIRGANSGNMIQGEGYLWSITYRINAAAEPATRSLVRFTYAAFKDAMGTDVNVDYASGASLTVGVGTRLGDLTGDRNVTFDDLSLLGQIVLGELPISVRTSYVADLNGDGLIDSADFVLLRRYLYGVEQRKLIEAASTPEELKALGIIDFSFSCGSPIFIRNEVIIPLYLSDLRAIAGLELILLFNPSDLEFVSITPDPSVQSFDSRVFCEDGQIRVMMGGEPVSTAGTVKIANLRLRMKGDWIRTPLLAPHFKLCNYNGVNLSRITSVTANGVLLERPMNGLLVH